MPIGVGVASVGNSTAGYGTSDVAPGQQTILVDPVTGTAENCRKLDPYTGQYVYDSTGRLEGMNGIQQMVLMRAKTVLNSSAVRGLGLANPGGTVRPDTVRKLADALRDAMQDLVAAKQIEIVDIQVAQVTGTGAFRRILKWRDLTAATPTSPGTEQLTDF